MSIDNLLATDHTATYSPEDDKIRIYLAHRLSAEDYAPIKAAGFQYAPKQGCVFAVWNPEREALALTLAPEITAEGTALVERAQAKAERLEALAGRAVAKADAFRNAARAVSERFAFGQPILVGHHSERRARRDAARVDRLARASVEAAERVDYWNYRATAVERHVNRKAARDTRVNRIHGLLADLRSYQRRINESHKWLSLWETLELAQDSPDFAARVTRLAGWSGAAPWGVWSALDKGTMTPAEAIDRAIQMHQANLDSEHTRAWINHLLNRLSYERAELGDVERYEGALTPVVLQAFAREYGTETPKAKGLTVTSPDPIPLHLDLTGGRELTLDDAAWRDLMQSLGYTPPAKRERTAAQVVKAGLPLINPTAEQAETLQALWNLRRAQYAATLTHGTINPGKVQSVSQAKYSDRAKGGDCWTTIELDATGARVHYDYRRVPASIPVCKVRVCLALIGADNVVHVNDKPTKPLPLPLADLLAAAKAAQEVAA